MRPVIGCTKRSEVYSTITSSMIEAFKDNLTRRFVEGVVSVVESLAHGMGTVVFHIFQGYFFFECSQRSKVG